jgi:hypothetical protein
MHELQTEIEINSYLGRFWRPGQPLSDFVDYFWFHENLVSSHHQERILPMMLGQPNRASFGTHVTIAGAVLLACAVIDWSMA